MTTSAYVATVASSLSTPISFSPMSTALTFGLSVRYLPCAFRTVTISPPADAASARSLTFWTCFASIAACSSLLRGSDSQLAGSGRQNACILRSESPHPTGQPLVDRGPAALDNGALDHPPPHEEWNYR